MDPTLYKVPTGSTGPRGTIYDVFQGQNPISDPNDPRLKGIDIGSLPTGQAPQGFQSKFNPVQAPSSTPTSVSQLGGGASPFSNAIMGLLTQYQQLGTKPFQTQALNAQQNQIAAGQTTDPSLIGASPSTQASVRAGQQGVYSPVISGAQNAQQTFTEQLGSFGNALSAVSSFQQQQQQNARDVINNAFTQFGGGAFDNVPQDQVRQLEQAAGLPTGFVGSAGSTIKEKEIQAKTLQTAQANYYKDLSLQIAQQRANTQAYTAGLPGQNLQINPTNPSQIIPTPQNTAITGGNPQTYSSDPVQNLAQQLVNGDIAPSELSKRTGVYNRVLTAANQYSLKTTGKPFDIAKADRDYNYAKNPQTLNTLNYLSSLTGRQGQGGNLDALLSLSDQIDRTNFPPINSVEFTALENSGDPNVAAYLATVTEVADQVAKILQGGGTGSGTSDAKLAQAQGILSGSFSKQQLKAIAQQLKTLLSNRKSALVGNNPYLKDYSDTGTSNQASSPQFNTSQIKNDVQHALHDTSRWQTREQLIPAIAQEYNVSQDQAAQYVYTYWPDNAKR